MKAVTVAGGSSDDPKIEGTTVAGADPDDTSAGAGAGSVPEGRATQPEAASGASTADGEPEAEVDERTGTAPEAGSTADAPGDTDAEDAEDAENAEDAEDAASQQADATRVLRVPSRTAAAEAPDDADTATPAGSEGPTEATAEARSRTESEDEPEGTDTEDEGPEASDATRVLKMPARATATPDADADTSVPAEAPAEPDAAEEETSDRADEPEGTDTDEAPEASDATPDDAADNEPSPPAKAPAEPDADEEETSDRADEPEGTDTDDEGPEASDATRVLKMPARATATPDADTDTDAGADDDGPERDDATRVLKMPAAGPKGGTGRTEAGAEAGARAAEKDDKGADKAVRPLLKGDGADAARDRGEPGAGRSPRAAGDAGDGPRVPGWAKADDKDPERTSQFVALKDLDVPPPVPARPQPQAPTQRATQPAPPAPLPPLDLLAELTNTPAPPETPRRTALRRVKVWTPILLLLAGACIGGQMLRPLPDPRLVAAETEHTVDGQFSIPWPGKGQGAVRVVGSGDIGTFGEQKPVPTASVAKIMTAYVVLRGHPLRKGEPGPDITVDAKAVADGNSEHESRITGLTTGSKFSQQDMLKMLMIPSGNNIARLLARWDTGTDSESAFVEKMNAAARELGMKDTTYTDPSGLDAGTVSTATDQLKLAEAVMKDDTFRGIVALPEAPIKGLGEKLVNNNHLLTESGLSIRGIKTGSSTPAGGTFVWAAYKTIDNKDQLIIGSLMEQRAPAPDKDALNSLALVKANSKKIIESARTALASTPLVRKGDVVGYVDDGLGGRTPLVAVKDLNVISVPGQRFKLSLKAGDSALPHTAKAGTEVAVLTAGEGEGAPSVPVAVQGALAEPSFGTRLTRIG
ncbi:serine hydrolase [Streptomyces sp. INR7]|uniref:serine hydrolase n=2 Tax=unclassified Streptomyces TaxID=2593676 RepID=UPI0021564CC9|nr:serine hydrolase [Streptomyces sp. INR7]